MIPFFFFLFGIVIGSFLNVCITRIPEGESIVSPSSRCPRCKTPIKPYDNVPILGWLWLRGKCRNCSLPISPMYPIIELLTGAFFVLAYLEFGVSIPTFKWLILTCLIIVLIVTDLLVRMLPDAINWFGFGLGLAFSAKIPIDDPLGSSLLRLLRAVSLPNMAQGVIHALLAPAIFSSFLWLLGYAFWIFKGEEGMGLGDVKMIAMIGVFLGIQGTLLTLLIGSLLGSVVGILNLLLRRYVLSWDRRVAERAHRRGMGVVTKLRWEKARRYRLPLGTFLGVAALIVVYVMPYVQPLLPR